MADDPNQENAEEEGKKKTPLILIAVVGIVAVAAGFATPMLLDKFTAAESPQDTPPATTDDNGAFIEFGEIVVNLDEPKRNRYLRINISLEVDEAQTKDLTETIEKKKILLKNWLLAYLADQTLESLRGAEGQNRLRREIKNQFNKTLFDDNFERIRNVLFTEFSVQ